MDFLQPIFELRLQIFKYIFQGGFGQNLYSMRNLAISRLIEVSGQKCLKIHEFWLEDILKTISDSEIKEDLSVLFSNENINQII